MRCKTSLILSFLFCGLALNAQKAVELSLQDAISYAVQQSTTMKNAQIALADADQQIIERRAIGIPQLSGEVSFQRYFQAPPLPPGFDLSGLIGTTFENFGVLDQALPDVQLAFPEVNDNTDSGNETASIFFKNNFTMGLNLDAMLFDYSYFSGLKAAKAFRTYSGFEYDTNARQVRMQVTNAYLPVLLLKKNGEILDKNIANLEKLNFETKELYKAGFAEQLDIDRQDLSLSNLKTERENLARQELVALNALKFAMGYEISDPLRVTDDLEQLAFEVTQDDLVADINYTQRPDYNLIEQGILLNELNVDINRSSYFPTLRAFAGYSYAYQGNTAEDGFWAPTSSAGVTLNVPIFDGLGKKAKMQRARLDLTEAQNNKTDMERGITLEITNARTSYLSAKERLASQQRNQDLAQRIYDTTQVKYREGVGSSLELTQAEQSLYSAQSNYIQALYDIIVAKYDLDIALGK